MFHASTDTQSTAPGLGGDFFFPGRRGLGFFLVKEAVLAFDVLAQPRLIIKATQTHIHIQTQSHINTWSARTRVLRTRVLSLSLSLSRALSALPLALVPRKRYRDLVF